ncbi:MAG: hypothetical protein ACRDZX_10810 [Acidimicrobiales bacterium]
MAPNVAAVLGVAVEAGVTARPAGPADPDGLGGGDGVMLIVLLEGSHYLR